MKKLMKLMFLFIIILIINSSCKKIFGGSPCEKHKDVYTFQFNAGSQNLTTKRTIEVLHQIIVDPNFTGVNSNYNYFEVHGGGDLIVNYNPKKELLFVRNTDGGTDWPNVYPNITIDNLKDFPTNYDPKVYNGDFVTFIDSTFKKETRQSKINEAKVFLVTNLCK